MNPSNLYVIDSGVNDFQALIDNLPDGSEWILLDPARDGVLQLQEILLTTKGWTPSIFCRMVRPVPCTWARRR